MDKNFKKHVLMSAKKTVADKVFKNCNLINVYNGKIERCDVAVSDGIIVGVGSYEGKETVDLKGAYVSPALIDTHLHIESTMLSPANFAKAVVPHGVTTCIADPHEIANVCGEAGIRYMIKEASTVPMDIKMMMPSCVPATPLENNGAYIDAVLTEKMLADDDIFGLGEFMNSPAVLSGDDEALKKIYACVKAGKTVDGHLVAPTEEGINAYLTAGVSTDHENVFVKEAEDKLARGFYVMLREGTSTRNLEQLSPIFEQKNLRRLLLCTDDKQVIDLYERGHLDNNVRMLVNLGKDIVDVLTVATLNAAECYGLKDRGAVAPSKIADFIVFDNLDNFVVRQVYKNGELVAENGKALFDGKSIPDKSVTDTMRAKKITPADLALKVKGDVAKVIRIMPKNVVTFLERRKINKKDDFYAPTDGLNKICVVERHKYTGNVGVGLIEGYGITNGALALSIAHDSHNVIAVGDNDADIAAAVNDIIDCGGGWTIVSNGKVVGRLPLVVAGLMSDKDADYIYQKTKRLIKTAHQMGVKDEYAPFMALSFMSLVVIPSVKITDRGLFDVEKFDFTDIEG